VEDEPTLKITQQNFVHILLERVPEANDVVDDHFEAFGELLLHLLVADLLRSATGFYHSGQLEELQRLLAFMDDCLDKGDAYVENAIQVSFIENVGGYPEETPEFVASWPAGLLAERDRQLRWTPGPDVALEDFLRGFGDEPMDLPDGEISESSRSDWEAVLDALHLTPWKLSLIGDETAPAPRSAADLPEHFGIRVDLRSDLRVNLFDWGTVGFDIDLREITTQVHVNLVISFMRTVGHATRKSVTLSPEGMLGERPVITYEFRSDAIEFRPQLP
jgi:hypothetical protein